MLYRMIYSSQAGRRVQLDDIAAILDVSRRRNEAQSITGLLVFSDGMFFQVLEGTRVDLVQTINRIARDPRHSKVKILDSHLAKDRAFPDWHMGFSKPGDLPPEAASAISTLHALAQPDNPHLGNEEAVRVRIAEFLRACVDRRVD